MFELCAHIVDLIGDVFVIGGEIADVREIGERFLPFPCLGEPSRCFSAQKHAEEKDATGDKLKSERNHPIRSAGFEKKCIPLLIVAGKVTVDTIGDPETKYLIH